MGEPALRTVAAGIQVVLCSQQALLRTGLHAILEGHPDISVTADTASVEEAGRAVRGLPGAVVVVVDLHACADGPAVIGRLVAAAARLPHMVTLIEPDDGQLLGLLRAGALGLLLADDPADHVVQAIRAVASGHALFSPAITRRLVDRYLLGAPPAAPPEAGELAGLSAREREVFELLADGLTNAEIAARLVISTRTVKFHVSNVLVKLNLRDRAQAIAMAASMGAGRAWRPAAGLDVGPRAG
jgi:DNA-binding NarL/FixJ family response regulator